ncbi:polysaccharide biosynthesis protein [Oscillospiraceae bacterium MB08-C2-2]|nr:polysaccharide biosynthesis protein [Oscillospiraceae bacterium MB08-C2-2]
MKHQNVIVGTMILSGASILTRIVGFAFRVYINKALGPEGVGVYQLIVSLYTLMVTFASSGVSVAVSKLTAEQFALGHIANAKKILHKAIAIALFLGLTVGGLLFTFGDVIARNYLNEPRAALALLYLAPSLPVLAVTACLRGYLIAKRSVVKPALDQITEQMLKIVFITFFMESWMSKGLEYGCALILLGMTLGEIVSFFFLFIGYRIEKDGVTSGRKADITGVVSKIVAICIPISLSSYVRSGLRLVEDIFIVSGFRKFAGDGVAATETYGLLRGMAMPLLTFPLSMLSAFVVMLTPEISRLSVTKDSRGLGRTVSKLLQFTSIIGIFIVGVYVTFSYELGMAVYGDPRVGETLRTMAFLCPFMCLEMVVVSILGGLGDQVSPMRYSILDSVLRVGLVYLLIPMDGVRGFLLMVVISNLLTSILNLRRLLSKVQLSFNFREWLLKPALAALAAQQCFQAVGNLWLYQRIPVAPALILGIILTAMVYITTLYFLGSFDKKDVKWLVGRFQLTQKKKLSQPLKEAI